MKVKMFKDKETKNKVRFTAQGEISGSLYVDKQSPVAYNESITIVIENENAAMAAGYTS
jgi:hypothetical protein